jgi:hypothetical protein
MKSILVMKSNPEFEILSKTDSKSSRNLNAKSQTSNIMCLSGFKYRDIEFRARQGGAL